MCPVEYQIYFPRNCKNCGSVDHRDCYNKLCHNCTSDKHQTKSCLASIYKCINCHGQHAANSARCQRYSNRTFENNAHVIDILLGENIIKNKDEIFRDKPSEKVNSQTQINDQDSLRNLVSEMIKTEIEPFYKDLSNCKQDVEHLQIEVNNFKNKFDEIKQGNDETHSNLKSLKTEFEEIKKSNMETYALIKSEFAANSSIAEEIKHILLNATSKTTQPQAPRI